jgi:DNA-binding transcriptional regulator LsrR (DeoR family)
MKTAIRGVSGAGDRQETLAQIAEMYFVHGLSQESIANRTNYSRSMISRLLTEARESGIVEIRIRHPLRRSPELELAFGTAFELKFARVLARGVLSERQIEQRLGELAARALIEALQDNDVIGLSWGRALSDMVNALRPAKATGLELVQLLGSLGNRMPEIDGAELVRRAAIALSARYHTLSAPMIVANDRVREALLSDPVIRETFDRFAKMTVAVVGVGSSRADQSSLVRGGFVSANEARDLVESGAVGDVCAIQLDAHGVPLKTTLHRRIIGIDPGQLKSVPLRIGVASGTNKGEPLVAALRSRMINALVIDESAASAALRSIR